MNELPQRKSGLPKSTLQIIKLGIIGFIIIMLMIPVAWISSLIRERYNRRDSVIAEIADKWGKAQTLCGPVISVPYQARITSTNVAGNVETSFSRRYVHLSPENLKINGNLKTESHHRGIFKATGYKTDMNLTADFTMQPGNYGIPEDAELEWNNAILSFDLTDQHGLKEINGTVNGKPVTFYQTQDVVKVLSGKEEATSLKNRDSYDSGAKDNAETDLKFAAGVPVDIRTEKAQVNIHLILTGTNQLSFLTSGINESIQLQGDWLSPSFTGDLLPESRTINEKGFTATWHTNYLTTGNKQFWLSTDPNIKLSRLGVNFLIMVDSYQQTTRTLKYSILFLLLTFMIFFFAETITKQRIHPIQYLMVGCSLIVFYLLLLSISEHLPFGLAYLVAASGVILQISLYCYSILKTRKFALQVGGLLTGLYIFLYILLQLEDSALLIGSISLFVLLGIAMYAIRNVNWYSQE